MIKPVGGETTRVVMKNDDEGWWRPAEPLPKIGVGEFDYGYQLNGDGPVLPAPRSRRQPDGVHGWSRTFDPDDLPGRRERTGRQLRRCDL